MEKASFACPEVRLRMARPIPTSRCVLLLVLTVTGLLASCGGERELPTTLTPEEDRLVEEVLSLIEVRIVRARDADAAAERLATLDRLYDDAEIEAILQSLAEHPERGQLVMGALHDSIVARRQDLLSIIAPDEER